MSNFFTKTKNENPRNNGIKLTKKEYGQIWLFIDKVKKENITNERTNNRLILE